MATKILDFVEFKLAKKFNPSTDTTVTIIADSDIYTLYQQRQGANISNFRLSIFEKTDIKQLIRIAINDVASETTVNGRKQYVLNILTSDASNPMIGVANDDNGSNADANIIATNVSDLEVTEFSVDSAVVLAVGSSEYSGLRDEFNTGTNTDTREANGTYAIGKAASIRSDNKYEQSNSDFSGIFTNSGIAGSQASVQFRGVFSPVSVAGAAVASGDVYADSNGDLTIVETANVFVGRFHGALDTIMIGERAEQDLEYDNSEEVDQSNLKLMSDKNIKNFGLNGSETWIFGGGSTGSRDVVHNRVMGSVGQRVNAPAVASTQTELRHIFASPEDFEVSDGGDSLDSESFINFDIYVSDATKYSAINLFLVSTTGGFFDSFLASNIAMTTGHNKVKIKKSSLVVFNGTPNINAIADFVITAITNDISQPYITLDPASLQIVREDPTTTTVPNPLQALSSTGTFSRIFDITSGDVSIFNERNICTIAAESDLVQELTKQYDSYNLRAFITTSNSSITSASIGHDSSRGKLYFDGATTIKIDTNGATSDTVTITETKTAKIYIKKDGSRFEAVIVTDTETVTLSANDATSGKTQIVFELEAGERIDSLKVSNTAVAVSDDEECAKALTVVNAVDYVRPGDAVGYFSTIPVANTSPSAAFFGNVVASAEQAFPVVGNGVSMSSIDLPLQKQGSPTDVLTINIETSNGAGEPSGDLFSINSTGTVSGSSLPAYFSATLTTVNFAGAFTLENDKLYWVRVSRASAVDAVNYYVLTGAVGSTNINRISQYNTTTNTWLPITISSHFANAAGVQTATLKPIASSPTSTAASGGFVGFAQYQSTPNGKCVVLMEGVDTNQTGLTPLLKYYYSNTEYGGISTTISGAGIGVAVSDKKIRILKNTAQFVY